MFEEFYEMYEPEEQEVVAGADLTGKATFGK